MMKPVKYGVVETDSSGTPVRFLPVAEALDINAPYPPDARNIHCLRCGGVVEEKEDWYVEKVLLCSVCGHRFPCK